MRITRCSRFLVVLIMVLLIGISHAAAGPLDDAALRWLTLIDKNRFDDSWTQSSAFLKHNITKEKWSAILEQQRQPLGAAVSRSLTKSEFQYQIPGVPDGTYSVNQYKTTFSKKGMVSETVILARETDGQWKPIGYFIK
jgi:hypothetical protein